MPDDIQFTDRMSDADALMWTIEKDPALRSTITTVMVFDRKIDRTRLLERFERLSRVVPRLRQRVRLDRDNAVEPAKGALGRRLGAGPPLAGCVQDRGAGSRHACPRVSGRTGRSAWA